MDNIRNVLKIFFRYTSSTEVLMGNIKYNQISEETSFVLLANAYMKQYSNNEVRNMIRFLQTEFEWHNNKIRGKLMQNRAHSVNVFDAILMFADNVLVEENGKPLCRYENLLRWRDIAITLGEDMFITAYLAQKDLIYPNETRRFFWPPVIGHNNKALNRLMEKGVAENHFHLKGSAPLFHLSWISMMNDVCNPNFKRTLDEYESGRLYMKVNYRTEYVEESLYISYLRAALIRLYLFANLRDEIVSLGQEYVDYDCISAYIRNPESECQNTTGKRVKLADYRTQIPAEKYKELQKANFRREVGRLLRNTDELQFRVGDVQKGILYLKSKYEYGNLDYAIWNRKLERNENKRLNEIISGERSFLYEMFQWIYSRDEYSSQDINWFYAYLLIKENIRSEMIQANNNVGFYNFLMYQNRKEGFVENTAFEKIYSKMAIRDTIYNQHIKKLEARITPRSTSDAMRKYIMKYDSTILEGEEDEINLKNKFFYVCHFIKENDKELEKKDADIIDDFYCRHYEKRKEVERQAYALYEFRQMADEVAARVRGIDASAAEIGCRPEVFAQAFRFLRNQSVSKEDYIQKQVTRLPDIGITYHVGEDFLDIADGLRAIDEAISFLNMRCGDRLGHALALGVNVDDWYASKGGYILLPQLDYLDNLVWLYSKIRKYRLNGLENALHYIEKRYDEYFRLIYLNHISDEQINSVMDEAIRYYAYHRIEHNYGNKQCVFSINTYYDSWKLRGDSPEFFKRGFFNINTFLRSEWEEAGINKMYPENYRIRYNPEAAYLYYTYQYNVKVKREGAKCKEIRVNPCIIEAVKAVQKHMQKIIVQKGIAIETNPSSNALIGTFKRYDKHPILNWYNKGLETVPEKLAQVPQIPVSVNTDDQGVFATYIENEYAYLALALEKMKDEQGNPLYSRTVIYQWLDNIREMGLAQSFDNINEVM